MALRAAFSMTMIITGVANTGGRIASLNRSARCSGWTRRLKEPLAPRGICLMACPQKPATANVGILVLGQSSRTSGVLLAASNRYPDDRAFGGNQIMPRFTETLRAASEP